MAKILLTFLFVVSNFIVAQEKRPNIIFFLVDDQRYDMLSMMNHPFIETPNIDRLSDQGIRFDKAYSISPVCGPSRVGLLTGTFPGRSGVYWNPDMGGVQLSNDRPILPVQFFY